MTNAFEYGDSLLLGTNAKEGGEGSNSPIESNQPYLHLATYVPTFSLAFSPKFNLVISFRMVVLADEILESFFETDLSASFQLTPLPELDLPLPSASSAGFLGDLWSTIATDNNKKMFNMITDELGKTIGKHQVSSDYWFVFKSSMEID